MALGSYSPRLLRPLGIDIAGLSGQGLFDHGADHRRDGAPVSTVMDETYKVAITRLGDRIRVGGTAEMSGYRAALARRRAAPRWMHSVDDLFPRGGDLEQGDILVRPAADDARRPADHRRARATPTCYLNTGHGTLGWTMACGSGRVLADIISGRKAEIDTADLSMHRYRDRFG